MNVHTAAVAINLNEINIRRTDITYYGSKRFTFDIGRLKVTHTDRFRLSKIFEIIKVPKNYDSSGWQR